MPGIVERSPVFLFVILALATTEYVWRRRTGRSYDGAAVLASLGVALGQAVMRFATAGVAAAAFFGVWALAPRQLPLDDWRVWAAGFFAVEFAYYWMHRWSHLVRWMWATHAVHHSSNEYVLHAAVRLGWTGLFSGGWAVFLPLAYLGFHPVLVAALLALNLQYQFFLHTEAIGRLGPLEWVFNTPAHHRVHHASNGPYLDKNFGGVLIVYDRLFGSFAAERPDTPLRYGLTDPIVTANPFVIALREWRRMFADALRAPSAGALGRALFGRPGATEALAIKDARAAERGET